MVGSHAMATARRTLTSPSASAASGACPPSSTRAESPASTVGAIASAAREHPASKPRRPERGRRLAPESRHSRPHSTRCRITQHFGDNPPCDLTWRAAMACAASPTRSGSARNSPSAASASGSSCRPRAADRGSTQRKVRRHAHARGERAHDLAPVTPRRELESRTPPSHRPRSAAALRAPYRRLRDQGAHEPQPPAPSRRGHVPRPRRLVCHVCRRAWRARGGPPPEPRCGRSARRKERVCCPQSPPATDRAIASGVDATGGATTAPGNVASARREACPSRTRLPSRQDEQVERVFVACLGKSERQRSRARARCDHANRRRASTNEPQRQNERRHLHAAR